jgi:hypothetical protein
MLGAVVLYVFFLFLFFSSSPRPRIEGALVVQNAKIGRLCALWWVEIARNGRPRAWLCRGMVKSSSKRVHVCGLHLWCCAHGQKIVYRGVRWRFGGCGVIFSPRMTAGAGGRQREGVRGSRACGTYISVGHLDELAVRTEIEGFLGSLGREGEEKKRDATMSN